MSNIVIKIEAPELVEALNRFTAALSSAAAPEIVPAAPISPVIEKAKSDKSKADKPKVEEKKEDPKPEAKAEPATLESLRASASKLIANGKEGELKEILAKHGAEKLSKLDTAKYDDVAQAIAAALPEKK